MWVCGCICLSAYAQDTARDLVPQFLATIDFGSRTERVVRVNSAQSGLLSQDVKAVIGGATLPDALMLPKVENEHHLSMVCIKFSLLFSTDYYLWVLILANCR